MKKAEILKIKKGKNAGHYRFRLRAKNGEIIAVSPTGNTKTYTQKHSCIETLQSCFSDYTIIDLTGEF